MKTSVPLAGREGLEAESPMPDAEACDRRKRNRSLPRHEILVDRAERAAALYPDIRRAKALAQHGDLIEPAIGLLLLKEQFSSALPASRP